MRRSLSGWSNVALVSPRTGAASEPNDSVDPDKRAAGAEARFGKRVVSRRAAKVHRVVHKGAGVAPVLDVRRPSGREALTEGFEKLRTDDQAQGQLPFVQFVGQNGGKGSQRDKRHAGDGLTGTVETPDAKLLECGDANEHVAFTEYDQDLALVDLIHNGGEGRSLIFRRSVAAKQANRDGNGRDAGAPGWTMCHGTQAGAGVSRRSVSADESICTSTNSAAMEAHCAAGNFNW